MVEGTLRINNDLNKKQKHKVFENARQGMGNGLVTYLVTDLSLSLQGFRGAFLALFCDPRSPTVSALDLGCSSIVHDLQGVSVARSSVNAALRGVPTDGVVTALGDLVSSSLSSTSMVSTLELTVAMSTDTKGPILFRFLFYLASAVWVAAVMAAAREADILPVTCRVRHDVDIVTLGDTLLVAGASSSLPTDESKMYSSMSGCGASCTSSVARTL
jgi:hypothetical protein